MLLYNDIFNKFNKFHTEYSGHFTNTEQSKNKNK